MTIDREELAAIKKRHAQAEEDGQPGWHEAHAAEARADRAALLDALEAAEAREALNYYMEQHCAGFEDCGAADITPGDCHGCVAKRALAKTAP